MSETDGDPVRSALEPWLTPQGGADIVLLAVSGGPDSTALMHVAAAHGRRDALHVATVDHGLRPDSAAEAAAVARGAEGLGLRHRILPWTGPKPAAGLQAAARAARYRLLAAHAQAIGAGLVLTGHTLDDQAETVLMRLLGGSGPAGLAGMRAERALAPGLRLARPFLAIPKADLVAWCEARGIAYLRDPSNADDRFARARLRSLRPLLDREGLTAARLARLAERAARDEDALQAAARAAFAAAMEVYSTTTELPDAYLAFRTCRDPTAGLSSPLRGGAGGGGGSEGTAEPHSALPPPLTPPRKGEGKRVPEQRTVGPRKMSESAGTAERGGGPADTAAPSHPVLRLHGPTLAILPDAVALRVLDRAMEQAGAMRPQRLERLERLAFEALLPALRAGRPLRRTLGGLLIAADAAGTLVLSPAPGRRTAVLAAGTPELLGKGGASAYIDPERADGPAVSGRGRALPRD